MLRSDGFQALDAVAPPSTRWFVDGDSGRVVLVDGYAGRSLARLDPGGGPSVVDVVQDGSAAALVDRTTATTRPIDSAGLRLGPAQPLGLVAESGSVVGIGQPGVVAVSPATAEAALQGFDGTTVPFEVIVSETEDVLIAPDGVVWSLAAGSLRRTTASASSTVIDDLADGDISLVGNHPLVVDHDRRTVSFGDGAGSGDQVELPPNVQIDELVAQVPGPADTCGWVGADDELWCIGAGGVERSAVVEGLDIDGGDRLAIAGDAAALVRAGPSEIVRFDWRSGAILDEVTASVPAVAELQVAVDTNLVWVDDSVGSTLWAIHPWGINAIIKDDDASPLLGAEGEVLEPGVGGDAAPLAADGEAEIDERTADNNGIDDPPVAIDDPTVSRSGVTVPIAVTTNDYDPDGEAIVLHSVDAAQHGTVEIISASTLRYQPAAGFVGTDSFRYTIVDANATEASAKVTIELLPSDAPNHVPVASSDVAQTGADRAVVVDVLSNDIDPERDSLSIASFTDADIGGRVGEVVGPSGLPALRYEPQPGASGRATFSYRPLDALGAVGEPVKVVVDIAQPNDENRPPIVQPDSIRLRRGEPSRLAVLANDRDPDGDRLALSVVSPAPTGVEIKIDGAELIVTARAGAADLSPFSYRIDDGHGHQVIGSALVSVIAADVPNRAPVANADSATAAVGMAQAIDVLRNDSDPDGDALVLVAVLPSEDMVGTVTVRNDQVEYRPPASIDRAASFDRFEYRIDDGHGHQASGTVSVRIVPERLTEPPLAQDDQATTEVDKAIAIDVLRNDDDSAGERPTLIGTPGCPNGGTAKVAADELLKFTPPPGETGVFVCRYEVTNSTGLRASARVVVTVNEPDIVNQAPVVTNEHQTVELGATVTVDLLANDVDPDGKPGQLELVSSTQPSAGSARRDGTSITFVAPTTAMVVAITYQVGDPHGAITPGRVVFKVVEPKRLPPIPGADRRTIEGPGTPTKIDVLANDVDPDGEKGSLVVSEVTLDNRAGTINTDGRSVTITPQPDYQGELAGLYTVTDADGLTATVPVVLVVTPAPNRAPIAGHDAATVANGATIEVPIANNDHDPDGDPLTFTLISDPPSQLGAATLERNRLRFVASPGASGVATMSYQISDGEYTAQATITITVLGCDVAAPVASDAHLTTGYRQPISIDLANYARHGTITDVSPPLGAPSGVYTPPEGENGNVTITYTVVNGCGVRATGTITIDVNQDPSGTPQTLQVGRLDTTTIPVGQLAADPNGEPLHIIGIESAPAWVQVTNDRDALLVDPRGTADGDEMVVIISDPGGLQARVPLTIDLINQAPIAAADVVAAPTGVAEVDLLANDGDPDGDVISIASIPSRVQFTNGVSAEVRRGNGGRITIDASQAVGTAAFDYTIVDQHGAMSAPAAVTVNVNAAPVVAAAEVTLQRGSTAIVPLVASDPEGEALSVAVDGDLPGGVLMSFEPAPEGFSVHVELEQSVEPGTVMTVPIIVTDPPGRSSLSVVKITVDADPNQPPVSEPNDIPGPTG